MEYAEETMDFENAVINAADKEREKPAVNEQRDVVNAA